MADQTVKRVGHYRRKKDGSRYWVKPTTYSQRDRGEPGRGKEILPRSPPGGLRGWKASQPVKVRRSALKKAVAADGEKTVMARLQLVANFCKRTAKKAAKVAVLDKSWVAGNYRGKKKVRAGTGFARKKTR